MTNKAVIKKVMVSEDIQKYIKNIGRCELFDEIEDVYAGKFKFPHPYPRYLKAIRVALVELGYDEKWVESEFRDALEDEYLPKRKAID